MRGRAREVRSEYWTSKRHLYDGLSREGGEAALTCLHAEHQQKPS